MNKFEKLKPEKMSKESISYYERMSQSHLCCDIWRPMIIKGVVQDLIKHIKYLEKELEKKK